MRAREMILSWRRVLIASVAALFAAQLAVVSILALIAALRKRRAAPASFPHPARLDDTVDGNHISIYTYGNDLYPAMLAAIDRARHSIYLETYIWKHDPLGVMFKEHLARKAAAGIHVYVIFDSFANLVVPSRFKRFPPCIHTLQYRTLSRIWYAFDPRRYARDHRKLLIIDDEIAFIGGFNIGQLYATRWRDTHLRIHGPIASDLAATFIDFWNNNRTSQPAIDQCPKRTWSGAIAIHRNDPARLLFPIRGMYLDAIERAQHHIYLTHAYFIPDRVILNALISAAQRGVDVRILLPWQSNHVTADWLARGFLAPCLEYGIRIFAYQSAMIHAKTATIDGVWSTVGTANLDRLSLTGNYEINVAIYDATFAQELEQVFALDLSNAVEIKREVWAQRPWYVRAGEQILAPLRPLL